MTRRWSSVSPHQRGGSEATPSDSTPQRASRTTFSASRKDDFTQNLPTFIGEVPMIPLSPQLLVATATVFIGVGDDPDAIAAAAFVARLLQQVGRPELVPFSVAAHDAAAWDAAFVFHCGYWSHFDHRIDRSTWPILPARDASELAAFATEHGVLRDKPHAGDIFLQHSPSRQGFVRAGIVAQVVATRRGPDRERVHDVLTIEGATGANGELGGQQVRRILRRVTASSGDRFIRWVELEPAPIARADDATPQPRVFPEEMLREAA